MANADTNPATEPRPSIALVRKAIKIQGHVVMHDQHGREMHIRSIEVSRGKWVTDHRTADLRGRIVVTRAGKIRLTQQALNIIKRSDEITAERERRHRVAMGRD